jgi:hypothetical protein
MRGGNRNALDKKETIFNFRSLSHGGSYLDYLLNFLGQFELWGRV